MRPWKAVGLAASCSQPGIVTAMHAYSCMSRCSHEEVNTSREASHKNGEVSVNISPLKGRQQHRASLQSMVVQDVHALEDLTAFTELHTSAAALMMYASAMEEYKDEAYGGIVIMAQACKPVLSHGMPWCRILTHWRI